jgi:hypothetical protein
LLAKALITEAPDLVAQVETCTTSLVAAYESLLERRKQVAQRAKDAERVAEYTDAISLRNAEAGLSCSLMGIPEDLGQPCPGCGAGEVFPNFPAWDN